MAGRGSIAGLMPYGDANAIVLDMAREVLPVVKQTPVLAGVCGTDPFRDMDVFLDEIARVGFSGVQNFPTVGLIDGTFRANLEETGMSYALEVDMIARARAKDLLTTPYVFNEREDAAAMARGRRRHHRLPHGADDRRLDRRRDGAEARAMPCSDRRLVGGGAGGQAGRADPLPRRPDRRARGRRLHPQACTPLPRLLRRLLDGAPARRARADRANTKFKAIRPR